MKEQKQPGQMTKSGLIGIILFTIISGALIFFILHWSGVLTSGQYTNSAISFLISILMIAVVCYFSLRLPSNKNPLLRKDFEVQRINPVLEWFRPVILLLLFLGGGSYSFFTGITQRDKILIGLGLTLLLIGSVLTWAFYRIYKCSKGGGK